MLSEPVSKSRENMKMTYLLLNHFKTLLHQHTVRDGVLYGDLDLYPPGVWLGPYKTGIDDPNLSEAPQFLQAQGKQLPGLGSSNEPTRGRHEPSVTISAEVEDGFSLNATGYIVCEFNAIVTEGTGGGGSVYWGTAIAAKDSV